MSIFIAILALLICTIQEISASSRILVENPEKHRSRKNWSGLGAAVYLITDDWHKVRYWEDGKTVRGSHFNTSLDSLQKYWLPQNNYPIVLMKESHWKRSHRKEISARWSDMTFLFLNVEKNFILHNDTDVFEDHASPLHNINYKRMCSFFFHGLFHVKALMNFRYLMRMDDDLLIETPVSYDIFADMQQKDVHYGFYRIMNDWSTVTRGMHDFVESYVSENRLLLANPKLKALADQNTRKDCPHVPAFASHFEVIDSYRYRQPDIVKFTSAVVNSDMIFHRRWGDAPLRFVLAQLFWGPDEVVCLCDFSVKHWGSSGVCDKRSHENIVFTRFQDYVKQSPCPRNDIDAILSCPTGAWITQFTGRAGAWIDAVGIQCSDGTVKGPVGSSGGKEVSTISSSNGYTAVYINRHEGKYIGTLNPTILSGFDGGWIGTNSTSVCSGCSAHVCAAGKRLTQMRCHVGVYIQNIGEFICN